MKRTVDLFLAALGLTVLAPVALAVALWIRVSAGSPVLFGQLRAGLAGRPFRLWKFRTMTGDRDAAGRPLADERRLTPVGRVLRASSLDELPQLWNVLRGDMSLVGPRPLLPEYVERYSAEQARRLAVRPGITGWAQVNGRNGLGWEERFELDVWYVDNLSFRLDVRILCRTLRLVLKREGVSAPGHATMPPFVGSEKDATLEDGV